MKSEKLDFNKNYFKYVVLNLNGDVLALTYLFETAKTLKESLNIESKIEVLSNIYN